MSPSAGTVLLGDESWYSAINRPSPAASGDDCHSYRFRYLQDGCRALTWWADDI